MSEGFEYGNARVRARRGDLLNQARYQDLAGLDTNRLLATLSDTPYRPDLVVATPRYRGIRLFHEALRVNLERVDHWKAKGAQLSPTVVRLVKQLGKKAA